MNMKDYLWERARQEAVTSLTPEELEKFADAEQAEADARKAMLEIRETVKARNVSGYQYQEVSEVVQEMAEKMEKLFSPEEVQIILQMYPEELHSYADLGIATGEAMRIQAELICLSGSRDAERDAGL
jgi:oligoendopeptidase F